MEQITVGKYQLLDRIGSGGMAEVHLARIVGAAGFEKLVVVKRLLPALAEEKDYVAQFVDEARLAATFTHANIVSTFDFGEADGSYYIAMEYIEGKNLRRVQDVLERRGKKLPAPAAIHIVAEACRGLDYAHTRKDANGKPLQVVHRDVSPQNIVVSYGGDVKILDFGIAKSSAREFRTQAGVVKGKLRYMSPEQVAGDEIDGRSDEFAAAVILWELFFGKRWMPDLPDTELVYWVKRGEFKLPPNAPKPPDDLKAVLDKALSVNREDRYPSCGDFARALGRYNSVRWPDFTATDLARLLDTEFGEDMRRERAWIAGILGGMNGADQRPRVAKVTTNPGFMPPAEISAPPGPGPDAVTKHTPSAGFIKAAVKSNLTASAELPVVVGNVATRDSGEIVPKTELNAVPGRPVASPGPQTTAPPEAAPAKRRPAFLVAGLAAAAALILLGTRFAFPGASETPTPAATPSQVVVASPIQSPVVSIAPTTAAPSPTPVASEVVVATPVRTATPTRSLFVVASPRPTPRRTVAPSTPTPTPAGAAAARVSVSVPLPGWAEVWIDGHQVSRETPLINFAIPPGTHEIAVVKNGKKRAESITLAAGERRTVVLQLPQ